MIGESKQEDYEGVKVNSYDLLTNFFYNLDGSEIDVDVFAVDVTTGDRYTLEQKPLYKSTGEAVTELLKAKATYPINNKNYVMYAQSGTIMFHEPNLKLAYYVKSAEGKTLKAFEKRKDGEAGFHSYGLEGFTEGQDNGAFTMDICGEEVISVGAYCSKETYTSIAGVSYSYTDGTQENAIVSYSAWGADDNGVNHPDVVAPGAIVCSAYNIYDKNFFDQEGQYKADQAMNITNVVKLFNRNHYYGTMEGTSMAAPNATGVIALWLQANPNLTYDDVRKLIKDWSYNDDFTTDPELIPSKNNIQAGAGKIDALKGLQAITSTTDISTVGADARREATPATMYDADDNCYNSLGQRVSKNTKGLVFYKGKKYVNR